MHSFPFLCTEFVKKWWHYSRGDIIQGRILIKEIRYCDTLLEFLSARIWDEFISENHMKNESFKNTWQILIGKADGWSIRTFQKISLETLNLLNSYKINLEFIRLISEMFESDLVWIKNLILKTNKFKFSACCWFFLLTGSWPTTTKQLITSQLRQRSFFFAGKIVDTSGIFVEN